MADNFYAFHQYYCDKYYNGVLTQRYLVSKEQCNCIQGMQKKYCKHRRFLAREFEGYCSGMTNAVDVYNVVEELFGEEFVNAIQVVWEGNISYIHIELQNLTDFDLVVFEKKSLSGKLLVALEKVSA